MADENSSPDNGNEERQNPPSSLAPKTAKKKNLLYWTWKIFSICFCAFLGILASAIIVGSSPVLRASLSPIAILLDGSGYGFCDLRNPAQLSSKDHFSLEINSNRPTSYKLKIYNKNYADFAKVLGSEVSADDFNIAPYPPVSPEELKELLWNKPALYEHSGELQYVDFLKARAVDTMSSTLPLGDYIYILDQPQRNTNGSLVGLQVGTFRVSDLGLIIKTSEDKTLVKVFDLNSLEPVADAKVELLSHSAMDDSKTILKSTTANDGTCEIKNIVKRDYHENQKKIVLVSHGDDKSASWENFQLGAAFQKWSGNSIDHTLVQGSPGYPEDRRNYVCTDRTAYRLGQTVNLKGFSRLITAVGLNNVGAHELVKVLIRDPENHELCKQQLHTGDFGDFNFSFEIPEAGKTGAYNVELQFPDQSTVSRSVQVMQYRKPEFLVELTPLQTHTIIGTSLKAKLKARYFFGGPVKDAKVDYRVQLSGPNYTVRNNLKEVPAFASFFAEDLQRYNDGSYGSGFGDYYWYNFPQQEPFFFSGTATTNAAGEFDIDVKLKEASDKTLSPYTFGNAETDYLISATVTDLSRKSVDGSGTSLVTPSDIALVLNSSTRVLSAGEHIKATVRASDYDNHPLEDQNIKISVQRWEFDYDKSKWQLKKSVAETEFKSAKNGKVEIDLPIDSHTAGGRYFLVSESKDKSGRAALDSCEIWLQGADAANESEEIADLQVLTDKDVYKPGEKIRALIRLPKASANSIGLATLERRTIEFYQSLTFDGRQKIIEIPVTEKSAPNMYLSVSTVDHGRKSFYKSKPIFVYPEKEILNISIQTDKPKYAPGEEAVLKIVAKHQDGKPAAQTQLSLSVADESIYSLYPDAEPSISRCFYRNYENATYNNLTVQEKQEQSFAPAAIWDNAVFAGIQSIFVPGRYPYAYDAPMLQGATNGTIGPRGGDATVIMGVNTAGTVRESNPIFAQLNQLNSVSAPAQSTAERPMPGNIVLRSDFKDTALWTPSLICDEKGIATTKLKLPDNLTTWRASATAMSKLSDTGNASLTFNVSKDILARLSMARFFTDADEGVITGVVHNYTNRKQKVDMELLTSSMIKLGASSRQQLSLEPEGVGRFTWPVKVLSPGKAEVSLKVAGETASDGLLEKLPIRPFSYPAFACKNGILKDDQSSVQLPLKQSKDALPNTARFSLSLAASAIGPVLGNFDKLIEYPYGCTEQTMSRMVPSIVAMQLHNKLRVPLTDESKEKFRKAYRKGLKTIISYQNSDDAWGWWAGDRSNVYLTAYVLEGLYQLREAGFPCDQSLLNEGTHALNSMTAALIIPPWNKETATDHAYGLYVLSLLGEKPKSPAIARQMNGLNKLPPEGLSYLTLAFKRAGLNDEAQRAYQRLLSLSNKSVEFTNWDHTSELFNKLDHKNGFDYSYRFTGTESTALALRAVLAMEPKNEKLLSSIRRWILLQHDENGWSNTKTTASVFIALLEDEINASGGKATNFKANAQVGARTLASLVFNEKNQYAAENTIDFAIKSSDESIEIKKDGSGRLYYNSLLRYDRPIKPGATVVPRSSPSDLVLERRFFRLEPYIDPKTKIAKTRAVPIPASGIAAGETILMKVLIKSPIAMPYVMVDAALPSGAEVLSEQRNIDYVAPDDTDPSSFRYWWTHQDILDDRIVFFVTDLSAGTCEFQSLLRMEMPGVFNVVPVSLEGMYSKSLRAYSAEDRITVFEPK